MEEAKQNGEYRFDNCAHKGEKEIELEISRCPCDGGNYMATGFHCDARSIFKIDARICEYCWIFKDKNSTPEEKS